MRGILPHLMQEFMQAEYGAQITSTVNAAMGEPVFLVTREYPDKVLQQMAHELSQQVGKTTPGKQPPGLIFIFSNAHSLAMAVPGCTCPRCQGHLRYKSHAASSHPCPIGKT